MAMFWRRKALLCKTETVYATDPVPTGAANAILGRNVKIMPMEGQDVSRELDRPFFGAQPTIPVGLHAKLSFSVEVKGSGAQTAGTPPAYGPCLRACGLAEVIVAGTSTTYNPVSSGIESATFYLNIDGVLFKLTGARGTAKLNLGAQGLVTLDFEFTGLFVQPADQAMPVVAISTQIAHVPQVATTANTPTLSLGAFTPVVRSFSFDLGGAVETRFLIRSESVLITDRAEQVELVIEAAPLATFNPFVLAAAQTPLALSMVHGVGAGRVTTLSVPTAQMQRPTGFDQQQNVVEQTLRLVPQPSSAGNDQFTLAFT